MVAICTVEVEAREPLAPPNGFAVVDEMARRAGVAKPAAVPPAAPGSAFGQPAAIDQAELTKQLGEFQLPPELQQLFNPKNTGPR